MTETNSPAIRYSVGDCDERPWGHWEVIGTGANHMVKTITVTPGQRLSLRYHHHRAEHWIVVAGEAEVATSAKPAAASPSFRR